MNAMLRNKVNRTAVLNCLLFLNDGFVIDNTVDAFGIMDNKEIQVLATYLTAKNTVLLITKIMESLIRYYEPRTNAERYPSNAPIDPGYIKRQMKELIPIEHQMMDPLSNIDILLACRYMANASKLKHMNDKILLWFRDQCIIHYPPEKNCNKESIAHALATVLSRIDSNRGV
eukprot:141770_1